MYNIYSKMAFNLKYIINNILIKYLKIWIFLSIILFFYIIFTYFNYNIKTNKITSNIFNGGIYVTSGVAINNKDILVNKKLIDENCFGIASGKVGKIYAFADNMAYDVYIYATDKINDMAILRIIGYKNNIKNYSLLQADEPSYNINKRLIVPFTINKHSNFNFKEIRIVGTKNNTFFLAIKNIFKKKDLIGAPLFSKNYLLQGIIKEINSEYSSKIFRDVLLDRIGIQEIYLANNLYIIKKFLNNYDIKYSMANGNIKTDNNIDNMEKSVINIICIKRY